MEVADNTNVAPPNFGASWPIYPALEEMIRLPFPPAPVPGTSPAIYPGFIQQSSGPGTFRDRVACYLTEPNGIALAAGIYDARLVNEYNSLPLYATTCCPSGGSSSSSSPGH